MCGDKGKNVLCSVKTETLMREHTTLGSSCTFTNLVFRSHTGPMTVVVVSIQLARPTPGSHLNTLFQFAFVLLFPFHATILEPDLDLSLRQTKGMGDLYPSSAR